MEPETPVSPLTMAILLALARADLHGYALMREVAEQTGKRPGTGSLYAALERLVEEGLIVELAESTGPGEDARRKYFRITRAGRACARGEAARMLRVLDLARANALIGSLRDLREESR